LRELGFEGERLEFNYASAGEGERFARIVTGFVERIVKLGPNPLGG